MLWAMATSNTATDSAVPLEAGAVEALASSFRGALIRPGDRTYDEHRRVWNGSIDRYPALIARCAGVEDVIAAVRFARIYGLLCRRRVKTGIWLISRDGNGPIAGSGVREDAGHVTTRVSILSFRTLLVSPSNASSSSRTWSACWPAPELGRRHARAVGPRRAGCTAATSGGWLMWRLGGAGWC